MQLYHVSTEHHEIGGVVPPGRFGEMWRAYRPGGPMPTPENIASVLWEVALEAVRVAAAPDKPSRLNSIFCAEGLSMAKEFRRHYRAADTPIYRVEPVDSSAALHRGEFMAMSRKNISAPYAEYMSAGAREYWLSDPTELVEVLVPCPIKILEKVA